MSRETSWKDWKGGDHVLYHHLLGFVSIPPPLLSFQLDTVNNYFCNSNIIHTSKVLELTNNYFNFIIISEPFFVPNDSKVSVECNFFPLYENIHDVWETPTCAQILSIILRHV